MVARWRSHDMSIYEEVQLSDMRFDEDQQTYFYECPCGDLFEIALEELHDGEDIALCPSCSLKLRVHYDEESLPALKVGVENEAPPDGQRGGGKGIVNIDEAASKAAKKELEESDDEGKDE